jgi:serine/threonine-protein kinase
VDFGLAKANSQLEKSEPGIIKGKFSYLSPEAAQGQDVDGRTDIFAVGIILWELLTGQRLFLGETDFQTVKKVQQAVIPPVSQINPDVTPALEKIIAKALARDPNARYRYARDLARDLTKFLFEYGQAVSSFDVAHLVQGAMRDKEKERAKKRAASGSIIDKLIEEALFEFTSLSEEQKAAQARSNPDQSQAAAPLNLGEFVDPTSWLDDIAKPDDKPKPQSSGMGALALGEGNLSALEEDDAPPARPTPAPAAPVAPPRTPTPQQMQVQPAPPTPVAVATKPVAPDKKGGMGAIIGIIAAVVVVGGAAAAWFATHH